MGAKEDHAGLMEYAARLFGDAADDAAAFVHDGMKRLGYKPRTEWDDPEPSGGSGGGGDGGDFFTRQRQRQQPAGGDQQDRRRVGGDRQRSSGGGFDSYAG